MTPARTAGAGWRDAFVIADLLRTGKFTETQLRAGAYAELQLGHATYWWLRLDRGRQLTRLTNSLRQVFPELSQVFKDLAGVTAQAVIRGGPAATQIRTLSWADFLARTRMAACGQRLALSRLHRLYALAPTSIGLTQGMEALCFDVQSSLAHVQLLDQQTQALLARLRQVFNSLPEAPFLRSIQGLGEISALGTAGRRGGNGPAGPVRQWQGFNQAGWHPAHPESLWASPAFQDTLLQTGPEPSATGAVLGHPAAVEPQCCPGAPLPTPAAALPPAFDQNGSRGGLHEQTALVRVACGPPPGALRSGLLAPDRSATVWRTHSCEPPAYAGAPRGPSRRGQERAPPERRASRRDAER